MGEHVKYSTQWPIKCLFYGAEGGAASLWRRTPVGQETFVILSEFTFPSYQADLVTHLAAAELDGSHSRHIAPGEGKEGRGRAPGPTRRRRPARPTA